MICMQAARPRAAWWCMVHGYTYWQQLPVAAPPAHGSVSPVRVAPPTNIAVIKSGVMSRDVFTPAETKRGAERNTLVVGSVVGGFSTCSSFRFGGDRETQRARLRERVRWSECVFVPDPNGMMRINGALGGTTRRSKRERESGVGGKYSSESTAWGGRSTATCCDCDCALEDAAIAGFTGRSSEAGDKSSPL